MIHTLKRILQVPHVPHAHRVSQNLVKCFDMMWRFVDHPCGEMTNNLAERQIRKLWFIVKNPYLPGLKGAMDLSRGTLSLFLTCGLKNQNPFLKLSHFIANS
jgi:hypothetical protein